MSTAQNGRPALRLVDNARTESIRCPQCGGKRLDDDVVCESCDGTGTAISRRLSGAVLCAILVILAGCATCERHPVACTAAVAVIGASVALSVRGNHHDAPGKPLCQDNPAFPNGCHPIG